MWVRTTAIMAALSVAALTLVSAFPAREHASMQLRPARMIWDEPAFGAYRVADMAERPRQKLAVRGDRSRVDAAIAELIRRRAEERRRERKLNLELSHS